MNPDAALPWLLLAAVLIVLLAAVIGLLLDRRDLRQAAADVEALEADNANLMRSWRALAHDLATTRGERDLARDTVRGLLDARGRGHVYLRTMPTPPVDAPTDEFTAIVERNNWPLWPEGRQS